MPQMIFKRQVFPMQYNIAIEPNPLTANPQDKMLVVALPFEGDILMFPLNEEQRVGLHDGTAGSIGVFTPGDMPPEQ